MSEPKRDALITHIACESIGCIKAVGDLAKLALRPRRGASPIGRNAFTDFSADQKIIKITRSEHNARLVLASDPVIARIDYIDEGTQKNCTIFISPVAPGAVNDFTVASYRSPWGRLAERSAGDEVTVLIGDRKLDVSIESVTKLYPRETAEYWDSRNSAIDIINFGRSVVSSLFKICDLGRQIEVEDLDALWKDPIDEGVSGRETLTQMELRRQTILDRYQGDVFRLPIGEQLFLSGPPGTGKTTTLIKRLGQKTDTAVLEESNNEFHLIQQVSEETGDPHDNSWIMFSPTELLRLYVKEAFVKEGVAASDTHVRTWKNYSKIIARENLGILRTSISGSFDLRPQSAHIDLENFDETEWYDAFRKYIDNSNMQDMESDAKWLVSRESPDLKEIGDRLMEILPDKVKDDFYTHIITEVEPVVSDVREAIKLRTENINKILTQVRNVLTKNNRSFPDELRDEVSRLIAIAFPEMTDDDDMETEQDDEDEQILTPKAGQPVNRRQALDRMENAFRTLARYKVLGRHLSKKSLHHEILSWLGDDRMPSNEDMNELGNLLVERTRLRKFDRLGQRLLREIVRKYRRFRRENTKEGRWYTKEKIASSDIHWRELNLVILAILQIANEVLESYRKSSTRELPNEGLLGSVRHLLKAQVLVDEATDFSPIQLACMYEIAHPAMRSFFLCGDVDQRLTSWGIKSYDTLSWISPKIDIQNINVSYRQTNPLVNLAKGLARVGNLNATKIHLPDTLSVEGVAPIWKSSLKKRSDVAEWLTERVREIETIEHHTNVFPTIAVLVNGDESVVPLVSALNKCLKEINLSAVACEDGTFVGNDNDVRVFDIKHIKGLEFETVFFVDLDQTIKNYPDLFIHYLYVGTTRARTYLGITFSDDVPNKLASLKEHFKQDWS